MARTADNTAQKQAKAISQPAKSKKRKSKQSVTDEAVLNYVYNAEKGEKKTEAGIKYWFESNLKGHTSEDSKKTGSPDGYTPGWLLLELKGKHFDWIEGFFEGLCRKNRSFRRLVVASHRFLGIFPGPNEVLDNWSRDDVNEWKDLVEEAQSTDGSPSEIGKKLARKYRKIGDRLLKFSLFNWVPPKDESLFDVAQKPEQALKVFKHLVTSYDQADARIEITPNNFCEVIEGLLPFFNQNRENKFEAVNGFYRTIPYWNKKYPPVISSDPTEQDRVYMGAGYFEGLIENARNDFVSALTKYEILNPNVPHFFGLYDRAIDVVDSDYRTNHGIFFTDEYLARLAISLSEDHVGSFSDKFIVFDPACGSGNLVSSWNHHLDLRHKVVSEISPVLLKAFELRFEGKSSERKRGFTIIPKTNTGEGLNFVDISAADYLERINLELSETGHKLNKPLAIVCNPPYRNQKNIKDQYYQYSIHESISNIVGNTASNELFVCFLAQISEICRLAEEHDFPPNSVVLLFTQSGWLTRKPSYDDIRTHFLSRFKEKIGFMVNSRQFFDVDNEWPLVVSLWEYQDEGKLDPNRPLLFENYWNLEKRSLKELCNDSNRDFDDLTNWGADDLFPARLRKLLKSSKSGTVRFNKISQKLKDAIPPQSGEGNKEISKKMIEKGHFLGGLCFASEKQFEKRKEKFEERVLPVFERNSALEVQAKSKGKKFKKEKIPSFKVQGDSTGKCVGFSESKQPFRTDKDAPNDGSILYYLMDTRFIKMHTSQCFSGIPTTRGHMITGLKPNEQMLVMGYAIAHSLAGRVPSQFNQFDMWTPDGDAKAMQQLLEASIALTYLLNSCIECEIPKDEPVEGGSRIFVTNPLSRAKNSIWNQELKKVVTVKSNPIVIDGIDSGNKLRNRWEKWLVSNKRYRAQSDLAIYSEKANCIPTDGWGFFQIEKELPFIREKDLSDLNSLRKSNIIKLKGYISAILEEELCYWNN